MNTKKASFWSVMGIIFVSLIGVAMLVVIYGGMYLWLSGKTLSSVIPTGIKTVSAETLEAAAIENIGESNGWVSLPLTGEVPATDDLVPDFPASVTYTMVLKFSDTSEETLVMGTDFDLEDRQELWDRIKLIGLDDVVVTSDSNLLWFYNGYVATLPAGENSLGEIWRVAMSNDPLYDAGFSIRTLANGCSATASKGDWGSQAQTAVSKEVSDWLFANCAQSEMDEWLAIRQELSMPENTWTK